MARTPAKSAEAELLARGTLTLPKALRDAHRLKTGTRFSVIDLGEGAFMLVPRRLRVDEIATPLMQALSDRGESLESLLAHLDAQRGRQSDYGPDAV